jgi:hypothetical protein
MDKWHQQLKHLCEKSQESEEKSEKTSYVQRDLEDQIAEEYERQGRKYQRVDKSNNMSTQRPTIVVQDVLNLLKRGYTRYTKDDVGHGSIQSHYQLTGVEVKQLFAHSKLKARKTILPRTGLNIVDNEEVVETVHQNDVTGLEQAKVVVDALMELAPIQDVVVNKVEVSKEELFS